MKRLVPYCQFSLALLLLGSIAACSHDEPAPLPEPIAPPKAASEARREKAEAKARKRAAEEASADANSKPAAAEKPAAAAKPAPEPSGPPPFTVHVSSEDDLGEAPLTVKLYLDINPAGGGKPPYKIVWDFGDGTPFESQQNLTHEYKFPGDFRASAIVTDKDGKIAQDYDDVTVEEPWETARPPAADEINRQQAYEILKKQEEKARNEKH